MKGRWYVINEENLTSWSAKKDAAESFATRLSALKCARKLAKDNPTLCFFVAGVTDYVVMPATAVQVKSIKSS